MNATAETAARPMFKGFKATLTNHEGQQSPCYVVNQRDNVKFADGTQGPAFKVKPGHRYLVGSGHRYDVSYGAAIWVKAERVSK